MVGATQVGAEVDGTEVAGAAEGADVGACVGSEVDGEPVGTKLDGEPVGGIEGDTDLVGDVVGAPVGDTEGVGGCCCLAALLTKRTIPFLVLSLWSHRMWLLRLPLPQAFHCPSAFSEASRQPCNCPSLLLVQQ